MSQLHEDGTMDLQSVYGAVQRVAAEAVETDPTLCGVFPRGYCRVAFKGGGSTVVRIEEVQHGAPKEEGGCKGSELQRTHMAGVSASSGAHPERVLKGSPAGGDFSPGDWATMSEDPESECGSGIRKGHRVQVLELQDGGKYRIRSPQGTVAVCTAVQMRSASQSADTDDDDDDDDDIAIAAFARTQAWESDRRSVDRDEEQSEDEKGHWVMFQLAKPTVLGSVEFLQCPEDDSYAPTELSVEAGSAPSALEEQGSYKAAEDEGAGWRQISGKTRAPVEYVRIRVVGRGIDCRVRGVQ